MPAVISMLRGVNVGAHHRIKMEALKKVYEGLGFEDPQTYVQSGNVVFQSKKKNLAAMTAQIEAAIETAFGFHSDVLLRTAAEMRDVVARNPFAGRDGIEPGKLLVDFLASEPTAEAHARILAIPPAPEEFKLDGRELYIYFPNGQARPKLPVASLERALKVPCTGRNWNSVTKMLEMAEQLEA